MNIFYGLNDYFFSDFHLENVLGNPAEIRSWGIFGLPNEDFSLQSAIIIK